MHDNSKSRNGQPRTHQRRRNYKYKIHGRPDLADRQSENDAPSTPAVILILDGEEWRLTAEALQDNQEEVGRIEAGVRDADIARLKLDHLPDFEFENRLSLFELVEQSGGRCLFSCGW